MNKNLFEIEKEYRELAQQVIDAEGELSPELEEQLAINQQQLETKGRAYGYVIKERQYDNDIVDAEIARLTAIKKRNDRTITKLKETLRNSMEVFGVEEIKSPTLKICFLKSKAVVFTDTNEIPAIYKSTKVVETESIDKKAIKESIERGELVSGAELEIRKNVQVK